MPCRNKGALRARVNRPDGLGARREHGRDGRASKRGRRAVVRHDGAHRAWGETKVVSPADDGRAIPASLAKLPETADRESLKHFLAGLI